MFVGIQSIFRDNYLIWTYIGVPIENYPAVLRHLKQYQVELQKRSDQGNYWWELRACDYYKRFEEPKIIYPDISTQCRFYLDEGGYFGSNTTYFVPGKDLYLARNSKFQPCSVLLYSSLCWARRWREKLT